MAPQAAPSGPGGGLTKKLGPLPAWGWVVALVVGYFLYKKFTGSGTSSSSLLGGSSTATPSVPTGSVTLPGGYTYSGPAPAVSSFANSVLGNSASSPGQGTAGTSPGSGAGTPGASGSPWISPLGNQTPTESPAFLGTFAVGGNPYNAYSVSGLGGQANVGNVLYPGNTLAGQVESFNTAGTTVAVPVYGGEPNVPGASIPAH